MAVSLVYRKAVETSEAVEYRWGSDEGEVTARVVIDPRDPTAWPTVGGEEPRMPDVVRAVVKRYRASGAWPETGFVQH